MLQEPGWYSLFLCEYMYIQRITKVVDVAYLSILSPHIATRFRQQNALHCRS